MRARGRPVLICAAGWLAAWAGAASAMTGGALARAEIGAGASVPQHHWRRDRSASASHTGAARAALPLGLRGGGPGAAEGSSATAGFEVHYRCSRAWKTAFIHFSLDDGATWSLKPGPEGGAGEQASPTTTDTEMTASPAGCKWKSVWVPATSSGTLCFVFHDSHGTWDSGPTGTYYSIDKPGRFALKDGRLSEITAGLPPVLVVTDLDGTYIGDEGAIAELNDCWERQCVYAAPRPSVFVYNTGRSWESTRQVMDDMKHIPMLTPRAVIASVGTQVWWLTETVAGEISGEKDLEWDRSLGADGLWDRELAAELLKPFIERDWAHLRPAEEQNEWKVVVGARSKHVAEIIAAIESQLAARGKKARLIASGHGEWNYLDIVCCGAGKLQALLYVRDKLGFDAAHTVACGDSGNDVLMLSGHERGIIVGNAQEGLLQWVRKQADVASDGSARLVHATATHARGMVEGLRKLGFL